MKCKQCDKTFKSELGLKIHNGRMHKKHISKVREDVLAERRPKMEYCCYCGEKLP